MFGISTHLYVGDRLDRDHLVEIAAHGFDAVEVFAVKSHFDYRDRRAAIALAEWLDDTRLTSIRCTRRLRATTSTAPGKTGSASPPPTNHSARPR